MRRKESLVKTVKYAKRTTTTNAIGEITQGWGTKSNLSVFPAPMSDRLSVEMYGERVSAMKALIFGDGNIGKGDGVWLDGETQTEPLWKVVSIDTWPMHGRAVIERVL
jgi:hypothetical protein